MCDEGVLLRVTVDGRPAYTPAQAPAEHGSARLHAVLNAVDDHAAVLRQFVADLDPRDEAVLRALLEGPSGKR
jgi:hypothetical protein